MKAIFVSGNQEFSRTMEAALRRNGVDPVYMHDSRAYIVPFFLRDNPRVVSVVRAFRFLKKMNNARFNKLLIAACDKHNPSFLITNKGAPISPESLTLLRTRGIITVLWFLDDIFDSAYARWFSRIISQYDFFFSYHSSNIRAIQGSVSAVTQYIPIGIDPSAYEGIIAGDGHERRSHEVVFVGSWYPERERLLGKLTDFKLGIYGSSAWKRSSLAKFYGGFLTFREAAAAYRASSICLNIHLADGASGVNTRAFEIPASGGFMLADMRGDLPALFEIGKDVAVFDNEDDLRKKIIFYLTHPEERAVMTARGRRRVLAEHTIDRRISDIIMRIGQFKGRSSFP